MLGISNRKVTRIRYVFVLELACYRVRYIRDNVKYLHFMFSFISFRRNINYLLSKLLNFGYKV